MYSTRDRNTKGCKSVIRYRPARTLVAGNARRPHFGVSGAVQKVAEDRTVHTIQ